MANIHSDLTSLFTDIASAIRENGGSAEPIEAMAFPNAIRAIKTASSVHSDFEEQRITGTLVTYTNSSIEQIGKNALRACSALTTVSFPVCTTIGAGAFADCISLTSISFPKCTTIGDSAFYDCSRLTTLNFPACTTISDSAFNACSKVTSISFPKCTTIGSWVFYWCLDLTAVNFPKCTTISDHAIDHCHGLTTVSLPACTSIGSYAFYYGLALKSLYLTGSNICSLASSNAFSYTPIGGYSTSAGTYGSIYVPSSLLTSYQTASNWSYFSDRFVGI